MNVVEYLRQNSDEVRVFEIADILQKSGIELFLTGSRYFGGARPDSDWDFYCEYQEGLTEALIKEGFHIEQHTHYDDPNTVRYNDNNTTLVLHKGRRGNPEIHIQIVVSAELKSRVQNNSNFRAVYNSLSKKERTALWNMAYTFING